MRTMHNLSTFLFTIIISGSLAFPQLQERIHQQILHSPEGCLLTGGVLLNIRDSFVELVRLTYGDHSRTILHLVEHDFNFNLTSEEFCRKFACDITNAKEIDDIVQTFRGINLPLQPIGVAGNLFQIQQNLPTIQALYPRAINSVLNLSGWAKRTNFPKTWPIPSTDVQEIEQLLGQAASVYLDFAKMFTWPRSYYEMFEEENLHAIATKMLDCQSWDGFTREVLGLRNVMETEKQVYEQTFSALSSDRFVVLFTNLYSNVLFLLNIWDDTGVLSLWKEVFPE